ncbi:MAG: flagellar assembly protein FliW [Acidimicrobiales bacterium]
MAKSALGLPSAGPRGEDGPAPARSTYGPGRATGPRAAAGRAVPPRAAQDLTVPELRFAAGIPGFPEARQFSVKPWGDGPSPFLVLESREIAGLRFVAVGPGVFFPWYQPRFGGEIYQAIEAAGSEETVVLVILTVHSRPEETTANLLGPMVINARTGQAVQAVLSGSGFAPQTPVVAKP